MPAGCQGDGGLRQKNQKYHQGYHGLVRARRVSVRAVPGLLPGEGQESSPNHHPGLSSRVPIISLRFLHQEPWRTRKGDISKEDELDLNYRQPVLCSWARLYQVLCPLHQAHRELFRQGIHRSLQLLLSYRLLLCWGRLSQKSNRMLYEIGSLQRATSRGLLF